MAGTRLALIDSNPCVLRYGRAAFDAELPLAISPPCTFHRNSDGTVRVRTLNQSQVLLAERSAPDPQRPGDCDTRVQAIVVTADAVRVSKTVERVAICTPFQWDDVMFLGLLESVEP